MRKAIDSAVIVAVFLIFCSLEICAQNAASQTMLERLGEDKLRAEMEEYNRALGVECSHCHIPDRCSDESKPQFNTARNMGRMVGDINNRLLLEVGRVSCWTCHRGEVRPSRLPLELLDAELTRWPSELSNAQEVTRRVMAVYTVSLGVACDHCHDTANWKEAAKRPMRLVARMNAP